MVEFELLSEWGGWEHTTILDDLEVEFRADSSSREFESSLRDICHVLGLVRHRTGGETVIGTGAVIELSFGEGDRLDISVNSLQSQTSVQELENKLTSLVHTISTEKDQAKGLEYREQEIEHLNRWLVRRGVGYDVEKILLSG
ncbi:hypothetical protein [Haloferax sp. DFSO60]|uniref:hypothetical protein n=1 Tax=Haloferax sp. DFSO60 TaxID=3388652 RepID=UPI00397BC5BA